MSSSSTPESLLYSPLSLYVNIIDGLPSMLNGNGLFYSLFPTSIHPLDYLTNHHEEGFILWRELGKSETIHPTEGNASGSSAVFEDAGEEVLAAEAGRVQNNNGSQGAPADTV